MESIVDFVVQAAAIAWLTTSIVAKDGPDGLLRRFREFADRIGHSPFRCFHCASFWITLVIIPLYICIPGLVYIFALMGLAQALRGASGEWS